MLLAGVAGLPARRLACKSGTGLRISTLDLDWISSLLLPTGCAQHTPARPAEGSTLVVTSH